MAKLEKNINKIMKNKITLDFELKGIREFKFRIGIAKLLLRLTAFLLYGDSNVTIMK